MLAFPHSVSFYCPNVNLDLIFLLRICKIYYKKLEEMLFHFLKNIKIFI